jgi:hypothetical protein
VRASSFSRQPAREVERTSPIELARKIALKLERTQPCPFPALGHSGHSGHSGHHGHPSHVHGVQQRSIGIWTLDILVWTSLSLRDVQLSRCPEHRPQWVGESLFQKAGAQLCPARSCAGARSTLISSARPDRKAQTSIMALTWSGLCWSTGRTAMERKSTTFLNAR